VNKSSVPVEFSWRAFATEREEYEKKQRLNMQLSQEESEERSAIEDHTTIEDSPTDSLNSDDSYDEDEIRAKHARSHQKAVATLSRKYQSIRKAVDEDPMLF
jgi:hydrocephalus-inducing protein